MRFDLDLLLRNLEKDRIRHDLEIKHGYIRNHRFISKTIYCELKSLTHCEHCGKELDHPPEIHHIIPIFKGGSNNRKNLLGVCKLCHDFLDAKNE